MTTAANHGKSVQTMVNYDDLLRTVANYSNYGELLQTVANNDVKTVTNDDKPAKTLQRLAKSISNAAHDITKRAFKVVHENILEKQVFKMAIFFELNHFKISSILC